MIPLIFASSILIFPATWLATSWASRTIGDVGSPSRSTTSSTCRAVGDTGSVLLAGGGVPFFYTLVIFQQQNIAENLQKQGGFIRGSAGTPYRGVPLSVLIRITLSGRFSWDSSRSLRSCAANAQTLTEATALLIVVGVGLIRCANSMARHDAPLSWLH